ncbi:MAG: hypothetical protein ACPL0C_04895 [Candidatus Bathyarchaeales archaeon]
MAKKKISKGKKQFTTRQLIIISLLITTLTISIFLLFYYFLWASTIKFSFKAAIVDQLESAFENQSFVENVTQILQQYNFTVMHNRSAEINVNFYKNLPKSNSGVIIFRVHSAIRNSTNVVDFFTSERYKDKLYEEYGDALSVAWLPWEPGIYYFAIGPKFVKFMDGVFPKSVVIAMGCNSLNGTTMAQAFIDRGAKLYIGWTGSVSIGDSDKATLKLLELLFIQNMTIKDAVNQCNRIQFEYPGRLDYFPKGADVDNEKVWDLVLDSISQSSVLPNLGESTFFMFAPFRVALLLESSNCPFIVFGDNVIEVRSKRVSRTF